MICKNLRIKSCFSVVNYIISCKYNLRILFCPVQLKVHLLFIRSNNQFGQPCFFFSFQIEITTKTLAVKGQILHLLFCHCHSHNAYQKCLHSSSVQSYRGSQRNCPQARAPPQLISDKKSTRFILHFQAILETWMSIIVLIRGAHALKSSTYGVKKGAQALNSSTYTVKGGPTP